MAKQRAVINKIKKLLALSDLEKNNNVNEAIAAASAAQTLMDKHRLTYEKIAYEADGLKLNATIVDYIKHFGTFFGTRDPAAWEQALAKIIADHNRCRCYAVKLHPDAPDAPQFVGMSLIGQEEDVLITEEIYFYLDVEINKICLQEWSKKEFVDNSDETRRWRGDFCLGAVAQLKNKLDEFSKKDVGEEYKFALIRLEKLNESVEEYFSKLKFNKLEAAKPENYYPFNRGYKAAEKISINRERQIETTKI